MQGNFQTLCSELCAHGSRAPSGTRAHAGKFSRCEAEQVEREAGEFGAASHGETLTEASPALRARAYNSELLAKKLSAYRAARPLAVISTLRAGPLPSFTSPRLARR